MEGDHHDAKISKTPVPTSELSANSVQNSAAPDTMEKLPAKLGSNAVVPKAPVAKKAVVNKTAAQKSRKRAKLAKLAKLKSKAPVKIRPWNPARSRTPGIKPMFHRFPFLSSILTESLPEEALAAADGGSSDQRLVTNEQKQKFVKSFLHRHDIFDKRNRARRRKIYDDIVSQNSTSTPAPTPKTPSSSKKTSKSNGQGSVSSEVAQLFPREVDNWFQLDGIRKRKNKPKGMKTYAMSSRERKALKLYDPDPKEISFELFLPIHDMWKQYMDIAFDLDVDLSKVTAVTVGHRLCKCDFTGAILMVTQSRCPSLVGLSGIVIQETRHTFKLVSSEDTVKVVPKMGSVFSVDIQGYRIDIQGSQLGHRAADRSVKKYKFHSSCIGT